MNAEVDKRTTKANEPVSLKVTISGTGNVKLLEAPLLEIPPDFEQFSPKVSDNVTRKGDLVAGSKTFEYLLIPRYPGKKTIKPVSFSYYDLRKRRYETLTSKEVVLEVEPGAAGVAGSPLAGTMREGVQVLSQDIRFIRTEGELGLRGDRFYSLPLVAGLALLPVAGFAGLVIAMRRREADRKDVAGFRNRKAVRVAQKGLRHAKQMLGKPEMVVPFAAEIARALWAYLGDKLNLQQADLSLERVEQELQVRGVEVGVATAVRSLLETCEMARFAPAGSAESDMQKMFGEAGRIIVETEKQMRKR